MRTGLSVFAAVAAGALLSESAPRVPGTTGAAPRTAGDNSPVSTPPRASNANHIRTILIMLSPVLLVAKLSSCAVQEFSRRQGAKTGRYLLRRTGDFAGCGHARS